MTSYETEFSLSDYQAIASDDVVKTDLELTCLLCGSHLCDVENGDGLNILISVAKDHWDEVHAMRKEPS